MPAQRGQILKKITIQELKEIVCKREHDLLVWTPGQVNPNTVPKHSRISIHCLKCGNKWDTKVGCYISRKTLSGGCRKCYDINQQNEKIYPNSPCRAKPEVADRPKRRALKEVKRKANLNGPFGFIKNREDLINYLKNNKNVHNDYVFNLVLRDEENKKNKSKKASLAASLGLNKSSLSSHHVIPLHARGSPDRWNIILVTKTEHDKIHKLRYEVYRDPHDLKATYATTSDLKRWNNLPSSCEKQKVKPNFGVLRRSPEITQAIEKGMHWKHEDGYEIIIPPNSVSTVLEIQSLLINSLPIEHKARNRMESNKSSQIYIRGPLVKIVSSIGAEQLKKSFKKAYGFVVQLL
jgi:hypothetical protein